MLGMVLCACMMVYCILCACMMVYGSTEKAMVVLVKGYGSIGSVSSISA